METVRKFAGCALTVAHEGSGYPVELSLAKDHKKYKVKLTEEQITGLHAIFFDPTMILDVAEMDPVHIDFGEGYVELRWDFEIRKRHHLVPLRIPEESQEGISPEILELRKELFECRRQLAELSYVETTTCIGDREFDIMPLASPAQSSKFLFLIHAAVGTAYYKYLEVDNLFPIMMPYYNLNPMGGVGEQYSQRVVQYFAEKKVCSSSAEIMFNIEHVGISITSLCVKITTDIVRSEFYNNGEKRHKYYQYMANGMPHEQLFKVVSRGIKSQDSYVYLFRRGKETPPMVFDSVFDVAELLAEKEKTLKQFSHPHKKAIFNDVPVFKIYKVAVP